MKAPTEQAAAMTAADILTPQELAKRLKVPLSWVYKKAEARGAKPLPVLRIGRYIRFCWPDVVEWMRNGSGGA